jgi:hypothetical protein
MSITPHSTVVLPIQQRMTATSRQDSTDDIISIADLAAVPKGWAIMLGFGSRARPYADKVAACEAVQCAPTTAVEPVIGPVVEVQQSAAVSTSGDRWSAMVKE